MFKYSGVIAPGEDTERVISNVDLVPTVMNLLGIKKDYLPGIDVLNDAELAQRKTIFAEAYNHDIVNIDAPAESILYKIAVEQRWKLMIPNGIMIKEKATSRKENIAGYYSDEVQLFDLHSDPEESTNVASAYPAEVERLSRAINEWWIVPSL